MYAIPVQVFPVPRKEAWTGVRCRRRFVAVEDDEGFEGRVSAGVLQNVSLQLVETVVQAGFLFGLQRAVLLSNCQRLVARCYSGAPEEPSPESFGDPDRPVPRTLPVRPVDGTGDN